MNERDPQSTPTQTGSAQPKLLGAVICGGASSRMGQAKSLLPLPSGGNYLGHAISRLLPLCNQVVLAGIDHIPNDLLVALTNTKRTPPLIPLPDPIPHLGPLAGLLSALKYAARIQIPAIIITPVDMPHLSTQNLQKLSAHFSQSYNTPVIATFDNQHLEPLVAIYPTSVIPDLQRLYDSSDRSLYRWLKKIDHQTCKLPQHSAANMNSPSDLHPIEILAQNLYSVPSETVLLAQAIGRTLQSPVTADRDSPAANVSAMDGYALRSLDAKPSAILPVIGLSQPGSAPPDCLSQHGAIQIFTGAVVPPNFDLVVRREDVTEKYVHVPSAGENDLAKEKSVEQIQLAEIQFQPGMNIRFQGENAAAGTTVIPAGTQLHAGHVAAAANFGHSSLRVSRKVRVRIIVTGDELHSVDASVQPWQLRDSNGPTLASLLSTEPWLTITDTLRAPDQYHQLVQLIRESLQDNDAILLTGGVSMGDFDYVPKATSEAGAKQVFHKLPIRPGKPIFGAVGPEGQLILGLPGNPVSAAVGTVRFAKPLLRRLAGCTAWLPPKPLIQLDEAGTKTIPLTWFRLVQIASDGRCTPTPSQGSGDLVSMSHSTGFIEVPPNEAGPGPWPLWRWND